MSDPRPDPVQDLAAAYALGALSPEERRQFETYLATSPEARREVDEYREAAAVMALGQAGTATDPGLKGRVLDRIAATRSMPGVRDAGRRASPLLRMALAASLLMTLGLGAALVAARGELASLRRALDGTSARLAAREATLNAMLEPGVRLVQLTATGDPDPAIQLFWNTQRHRAILQAHQLRPVPEGRTYQLWFIRDGAPVPSVTFRPGPDGRVRVDLVQIPDTGTVSAAAVTVEPEGGSAQPTTPILLVGELQPS